MTRNQKLGIAFAMLLVGASCYTVGKAITMAECVDGTAPWSPAAPSAR